MKKHLQIISVMLLLAVPIYTLAHAVVTKNSLTTTPIAANQVSIVHLEFNSSIEVGLSQFFLVSAGDKEQLLSSTLGEKAGEVLISVPALPLGQYAIKLKAFAVDGHLTEEIIRFSVTK